MSEWNNAIAQYLAAEENCREGSNVFAKLNAIRCEFAIRNGHDSYDGVRDDGVTATVPINWDCQKHPTDRGSDGNLCRSPDDFPREGPAHFYHLGIFLGKAAFACPRKAQLSCGNGLGAYCFSKAVR